MNTLASFLGDSVRSFFRRSEVRRAVQEITKSSSQFVPKIELIGQNGIVNERVSLSIMYLGKQLWYGNSYSGSNPSIVVQSPLDVTLVNMDAFLPDGLTPTLQEVVITATEVITTDSYIDENINLNTPIPVITFSPQVKYLGYPGVDLNFSLNYNNIVNGEFPKMQGEGLLYLRSVDLNVQTLALENDLSDFVPSRVVIENFYLQIQYDDAVNTLVLPHCTIIGLDISAWPSNFSVETIDFSGTKFVYYSSVSDSTGDLDIPKDVTNILFAPVEEIKEMPFYIDFGYSPNINQDNIDTLLEILVALDGTNGTTLWVGNLWMAELPEPTEYAIARIQTLIERGATVAYTQPVTE